MLSSSTSVFLFRILLKEFLLKSQICKALLLKIYIYGNICHQLCLPFIAAIFEDSLLRLFQLLPIQSPLLSASSSFPHPPPKKERKERKVVQLCCRTNSFHMIQVKFRFRLLLVTCSRLIIIMFVFLKVLYLEFST